MVKVWTWSKFRPSTYRWEESLSNNNTQKKSLMENLLRIKDISRKKQKMPELCNSNPRTKRHLIEAPIIIGKAHNWKVLRRPISSAIQPLNRDPIRAPARHVLTTKPEITHYTTRRRWEVQSSTKHPGCREKNLTFSHGVPIETKIQRDAFKWFVNYSVQNSEISVLIRGTLS